MMFFSFARNSSSLPLSCAFGLGFIPSPPNKIARFLRSPRQNLAISQHKNQLQSYVKCRFVQFLTEDPLRTKNKNGPSRLLATGRPFCMLLNGAILILAATYVPTQLPVQYHRPYGA